MTQIICTNCGYRGACRKAERAGIWISFFICVGLGFFCFFLTPIFVDVTFAMFGMTLLIAAVVLFWLAMVYKHIVCPACGWRRHVSMSERTHPPTAPGPVLERPSAWPRRCGVASLLFAAYVIASIAYLAYVYRSNPQFSPSLRLWCYVDLAARTLVLLLLCSAAAQLLRRRTSSRLLFLVWAACDLTWPVITSVAFLRFGEPSPDIIFAVLAMILLSIPGIAFFPVAIACWLLPPILVLAWFLRPTVRHEVTTWRSEHVAQQTA